MGEGQPHRIQKRWKSKFLTGPLGRVSRGVTYREGGGRWVASLFIMMILNLMDGFSMHETHRIDVINIFIPECVAQNCAGKHRLNSILHNEGNRDPWSETHTKYHQAGEGMRISRPLYTQTNAELRRKIYYNTDIIILSL